MIDSIEGFDKIHKDGIRFQSMLLVKKESFFSDMLGLLASCMSKLGEWVDLLESFQESLRYYYAEQFG
jgi:hypothetical protein